ncbi:MAG: response regulator [Desulfobacteraceae bacterium]|nr:response regulator [Desulfobacteraceae bacterium]
MKNKIINKCSLIFSSFNPRNRSISRDLTLSLVIMVTLVVTCILTYEYVNNSKELYLDVENKADEYISKLSEILAYPVWSLDTKYVNLIGSAFVEDELVEDIQITDSWGRTLFVRNGKKDFPKLRRYGRIVYEGKAIGEVEIFLTLKEYRKDLFRLLEATVLTLVGAILVITACTGMLLRIFIRKPLDILKQEMDCVANGDFSYKFEEIPPRELSEIASKFSNMSSEVEARENALHNINRKLLEEMSERKLAESALGRAEQKYRSIFENAVEGIFQSVPGGAFLSVNPALAQILGYRSTRDLIGKIADIGDVFADPRRYEFFISQLVKNNTVSRFEFQFLNVHGALRWGCLNARTASSGETGDIRYIEGMFEDITNRKQAELDLLRVSERRRELEQIINRSPVVVFLQKNMPGLPFEFVSESISQFGYSPEDFTSGRVTIKRIIHPEDFFRVIEEINKYSSQGKNEFTQQYRFLTYSRKVRWTDVRTLVRKDDMGNITHFQGIMIDITVSKEIEKAKVEREVAEAATHSKSEFLANMSHEIRTPMNAITGLTELAMKTKLTARQHDYLRKIRTASHSLLRIINDILDFSKIEARKLTLESVNFDLQGVFENLSALSANKAAEKGLELLFAISEDVPCGLIGDPYRLGQILTNLTSNAVKFTNKGEVLVNVTLEKKNTKRVMLKFSVRDSGIGMPAELLPKLFSAFTQADGSTTRKYGGTGLGLAISKQLSEMMNGTIWVESEPGRGSIFYFTAEFALQQKYKKFKPIVPDDLCGMRVLVVDDNRFSREILQRFLTSLTFETTSAGSGEEALEELKKAAEEDPYKLVLMDWRMPDMDGVDTIKLIKDAPWLDKLPTVIMVTAFDRDDVAWQTEYIGVNSFLIKPITQSLLFDTIMEVFERDDKSSRDQTSTSERTEAEEKIRWTRILLVEDNSINRQVAMELLENAGVMVGVANNGKEAILALEKFDYDAVLMDVQMPEMDGYEATELIRCDPGYKDLPIIAMTAHAMTGDRERCLKSGMNDYLTKPIDTGQLFSTLAKWIKSKKREPDKNVLRQRIPAKHTDVLLPDTLPGFDIESAMKRLENNTGLYKKLLKEFQRDYVGSADRIRDALEKDDKNTALRLAHTLKGVGGNIAACELQEAASKLEMGIKHRKTDDYDSMLEDVEKILDNLMESLKGLDRFDAETKPDTVEADESSDEAVQTDPSKVVPLLLELSALLQENDLEAEDCFCSIKEHLNGPMFKKEIERLEDNISRLDFKGAQAPLAGIAEALNVSLSGGTV